LPAYLESERTVAIAGVDTRRLTRVLRRTGAQNGCIVAFAVDKSIDEANPHDALQYLLLSEHGGDGLNRRLVAAPKAAAMTGAPAGLAAQAAGLSTRFDILNPYGG